MITGFASKLARRSQICYSLQMSNAPKILVSFSEKFVRRSIWLFVPLIWFALLNAIFIMDAATPVARQFRPFFIWGVMWTIMVGLLGFVGAPTLAALSLKLWKRNRSKLALCGLIFYGAWTCMAALGGGISIAFALLAHYKTELKPTEL